MATVARGVPPGPHGPVRPRASQPGRQRDGVRLGASGRGIAGPHRRALNRPAWEPRNPSAIPAWDEPTSTISTRCPPWATGPGSAFIWCHHLRDASPFGKVPGPAWPHRPIDSTPEWSASMSDRDLSSGGPKPVNRILKWLRPAWLRPYGEDDPADRITGFGATPGDGRMGRAGPLGPDQPGRTGAAPQVAGLRIGGLIPPPRPHTFVRRGMQARPACSRRTRFPGRRGGDLTGRRASHPTLGGRPADRVLSHPREMRPPSLAAVPARPRGSSGFTTRALRPCWRPGISRCDQLQAGSLPYSWSGGSGR